MIKRAVADGALDVLHNISREGTLVLWKRRKTFRYTCACCGDEFTGAPSFASLTPPLVNDVPEDEREGRVLFNSDLCRIRARMNERSEEDIYAIRATLLIPIHGSDEPFSWGVWVTQSEQDFYRYLETGEEDQSSEVSFGWLPVTMTYYQDFALDDFSATLACSVNWGPQGFRPTVTLHKCEHPLYLDQANGINWDKAVMIAQECMKAAHKP